MKRQILSYLILSLAFINPIGCFEDINIDQNNSGESCNYDSLRGSKCKNVKVNNLTVCSNLCANNACINNITTKNIINGPSYVYGNAKFVDPVNGSDNNNGGIASPFKTITKALSTITDNSNTNRYAIILFAGTTVDSAPINWKPYVSLFGSEDNACSINQSINYTASPGEVSIMDFAHVDVSQGGVQFNINASASTRLIARIFDCRCNFTWNGGASQSTLALEGATRVVNGLVIDGLVQAVGSNFNTLTVNNGIAPIVDIIGGNLATGFVVSLNGNAQLITRGVLNQSTITGNAIGGNVPVWNTDASSMTPVSVNTGPNLAIFESDVIVKDAAADLTITKETIVLMDATSGARNVFLPPASSYVARPLTVKKVDSSANAVTIQPFAGNTIDGAANKTLAAQNQFTTIVSDGTNWFIIN